MQSATTMEQQAHEPTWEIRPYQPGDEQEIVALFERAFGRPIPASHWRWKFRSRPSPVENVWLGVSDGKPVFHIGAIPIRYRLPTGESTVMLSVDAFTNPDFRRRGLLTEVGQVAYGSLRDAGIPFVMGMPNEKWGTRAAALGWETLFSMPLRWLLRPLRPEGIAARKVGVGALARLTPVSRLWNGFWNRRVQPDPTVQVREVTRAGPEFDELWQACAPEASFSAIRDSEWVDWRFLASPFYQYRVWLAERAGQPVGYVVTRLRDAPGRKIGYVAEMLVRREDGGAQRTLVAQAVNQLYAEGAQVAATLALSNTWMAEAFQRAGFLWSWADFEVQFIPYHLDGFIETIREPQQWRLTGADFDVL